MRMFDDTNSALSPFVEPFLMYHQVCTCRWTSKLAAVCDVFLASHVHACIPDAHMSAPHLHALPPVCSHTRNAHFCIVPSQMPCCLLCHCLECHVQRHACCSNCVTHGQLCCLDKTTNRCSYHVHTLSVVLPEQDFRTPCDTLSVVLPEQDFKNIQAGVYKLPWDMTSLRNKQYDPLHVVRTAITFASEASSTMQRRMRGSPDRVWLDSSMYPSYYLNTFHYQVIISLPSYTGACRHDLPHTPVLHQSD